MKLQLIGLSIGIFFTIILCLFIIYHSFFGLKEMSKLFKINIDINIEKQAK